MPLDTRAYLDEVTLQSFMETQTTVLNALLAIEAQRINSYKETSKEECLEQLSFDVKTAIPTTSSPPTGTTHPPTSPSTIKPDELAPLALALPPPTALNDAVQGIQRQKRQTRNDTVDFRHYMQPVANQMNCGGCWAFAMTSTVEGFFAMNGHSIPPLSVQELLDCDRNVSTKYGVGNVSCSGGYFQKQYERSRAPARHVSRLIRGPKMDDVMGGA
ncbi:hypothetical protein RB195_019753 [Necator americanus]|uniref:Peptidase C1A papain C-terminal domain-containing protein n=1 Tax=Necator americanus TaxID=51031 RepID=A0ABR1CFM5_NECAM